MLKRHQTATRPLSLIQINVGRGGGAHELALALAHEERIDIVLIQEPYIYHERERRITKRHPSYECFTPLDDWYTRPRVLTYIRKGAGLQAEQARPLPPESSALRDLLFVNVKSLSGLSLTIINIYNTPQNADGMDEATKAVTTIPRPSLGQAVLLTGDLNLRHEQWRLICHSNDSATKSLLAWTDNMELCLLNEPDIPTHKRGGVLDLIFASTPLALNGATTEVSSVGN